MALGLFDRKSGEARLLVRGREESLTGFIWKGNDRIVFYADYQGNESMFAAVTDLSGKKILRLVETQPGDELQGSAGALLDPLPLQPNYVMLNAIFRPSGPTDMASTTSEVIAARVNIRNRAPIRAYTYAPSDRTAGVVVDNAGTVRFRIRTAPPPASDLIWDYRATADSAWRELTRQPAHGYVPEWQPLVFSGDNRLLYLIARDEEDRGALCRFDTATLERSPPLFVPPEGEIEDVILSPDRTRLLGVSYESERLHYHWFDAERAAEQARLEATFPGLEVRVVSQSDDGAVRLVWVGSDREPGVYFLLDATQGAMAAFRRVRELDARQMRPMEPIRFTARDGLEIHGYLTRPANPDGRPQPLIIHPHGGPFGVRDTWGFDPEVQFLANRGYAVLQVNYRGSGGYGRAFLNLGRRQWGRAMQDDLTDAVHWAIDRGIADRERIAIMGASYGGYAALAGVTLTPDLYRCAVNYVGAADLEITFKNRGDDALSDRHDFSYQREWVGETKEYRAATSPVNLVERIRVPTLHAYGANDPRVRIDHWARLEAELKKHHKPYVAIQEKRQGHGFRDERASLQFYGAVEAFLAEHLAPVPPGRVERGPLEVLALPARR